MIFRTQRGPSVIQAMHWSVAPYVEPTAAIPRHGNVRLKKRPTEMGTMAPLVPPTPVIKGSSAR